MKQYIIRLLFKVDASGLKKQLQSISKEAAKVGAAMAKSMNRAFKTVAKEGSNSSKQVVKSLDNIDKKASQSAKKVGDVSSKFSDLGKTLVSGLLGVGAVGAINSTIRSFASLEVGLQKLQAAANLFGKDFNTIKNDLIEIRKEGVLSFETLNYTARQLLTPAFNMAEKDVGRFIEALRNIAATEGIYEDLDFAITSFVRGLQTGTAELLENLSPRIRAFIQTDAGGFAKVQKDQAARQLLFNEILESGAKAQEDYERLLGTTEFTTRKLNQSVLELRESIGEGLAPVFNELVTSLTGLTRGFTGLIESMTISQKSGVLVGTIFTTLGVILTPLIVKVGGLTAAMAGLGATLAAFAPTLGIIAALGVGLGFLTSKFVESRQSLTSLASEASKTTNSIEKLQKELSATNRLNDQKELLKLKKKQFELEGKIVDKIKDQVLSTVELRSAVRMLGAEGVQALQDSLIAEREILRERAKGQLGRFGDPVGDVGTTRRTEITKVLGEAATKNLETALTTGGEEAIAQAVRDLTAKVATGKTAARAGGVRSDLRQFILPLLKQLLGTQAGINEAQKQITTLTDPGGGGGDSGAVIGAGGSLPRLGRGLSLTIGSRQIEAQKAFTDRMARIEAFRENTKAMSELGESLESTGVSAEEYIERLKEEERVRYEISRLEDVSSSLGTLESAIESLGEGGLDAAKGLGKLSSALGQFLPGKLGGAFQLFGSQAGVLGSLVSLFQTILPSGNDEYIAELKEQRKIQEAQESYLKTLVDLDIQRQKSERSALDRQIDAERLVATRQKEQLEATLTGDDLQKEQIRIDQETNDKVIELLQQRLGDLGFTGELGTGSLADVSQRILQREQVGLIIQEFQSAERVRGSDLTGFRGRVRETASPEVLSILNRIETDFISGMRGGPMGFLFAGLSDEQLLDDFAGRIFKDFIGEFSQTEDQTAILEEQYDVLKQIYDLETNQMGLTNDLLQENNDIAKASLTAVQPRGFGAVDVSRGGLAFGRDFIPTAASLISNVGVPAQIGNLSVAAEANKTMDQKMLDSLQNQLIELKAQTNLLAQLTNTDARIVIANAQTAVKATGF